MGTGYTEKGGPGTDRAIPVVRSSAHCPPVPLGNPPEILPPLGLLAPSGGKRPPSSPQPAPYDTNRPLPDVDGPETDTPKTSTGRQLTSACELETRAGHGPTPPRPAPPSSPVHFWVTKLGTQPAQLPENRHDGCQVEMRRPFPSPENRPLPGASPCTRVPPLASDTRPDTWAATGVGTGSGPRHRRNRARDRLG